MSTARDTLKIRLAPDDLVECDFDADQWPFENVNSKGAVWQVFRKYANVNLQYEGGTNMRVPLDSIVMLDTPANRKKLELAARKSLPDFGSHTVEYKSYGWRVQPIISTGKTWIIGIGTCGIFTFTEEQAI